MHNQAEELSDLEALNKSLNDPSLSTEVDNLQALEKESQRVLKETYGITTQIDNKQVKLNEIKDEIDKHREKKESIQGCTA